MVTVLLVVIFICYIGLGLPDSLIGSAWPVMHVDLGVPVSLQGFISMAVSVCTVISSALSARAINRFGTGLVAAVSTALTALAIIGFCVSPHVAFLFVFSIPLGIGAGAIDAALNNYVALHYNETQVNFLHCFYGIGVTLSPYLMSLALKGAEGWREGFLIVFFIQIAITAIAFASLPIWKKLSSGEAVEESAKTLPIGKMLKMPSMLWLGLVFFASCGAELVSGTWCSTYFVSVKNVSPDVAAKITAVFYVGMSIGRFVSGLAAKKLSTLQTIVFAATIVLTALLVVLVGQTFALPVFISVIAVFFLGFGIGPSFASLTILIPKLFGKRVSQSIISLQMSIAYVGITVAPSVFGLLVEGIGAWTYPLYLLALIAIYVVSFFLFLRSNKDPSLFDE